MKSSFIIVYYLIIVSLVAVTAHTETSAVAEEETIFGSILA